MNAPLVLILFDAALLGLSGWLAYDGRMAPAWSLLGGLGLMVVWQAVLCSIVREPSKALRIETFIRRTHYVQAVLHTTIYAYLGLYWPDVAQYAPLIVGQILLGYLLDMQLSWTLRRVWRFGFGVVPIILSTNLFLWFKDEYFFLQVLLIVATFFSKEFITWNYDGRRRHIFNPSALPLTVASFLMLFTGTLYVGRGLDIAVAFEMPPNYIEVIFLLGLVVQSFFVVTPVSFGAALSMFLIFLGTWATFGEPISLTPIHPAVFLGMTFLVTDPATSPKTSLGRFLFGMAYGVGVMISFVILRLTYQPSFFDKLMIVPIVNLMVPLFDRISNWPRVPPGQPPVHDRVTRFGWLAAYVLLIGVMLPYLKPTKMKKPTLLPRPVAPPGTIAPDLARMTSNLPVLRVIFPDAYKPFGFAEELRRYKAIWKLYREDPEQLRANLPRLREEAMSSDRPRP